MKKEKTAPPINSNGILGLILFLATSTSVYVSNVSLGGGRFDTHTAQKYTLKALTKMYSMKGFTGIKRMKCEGFYICTS